MMYNIHIDQIVNDFRTLFPYIPLWHQYKPLSNIHFFKVDDATILDRNIFLDFYFSTLDQYEPLLNAEITFAVE